MNKKRDIRIATEIQVDRPPQPVRHGPQTPTPVLGIFMLLLTAGAIASFWMFRAENAVELGAGPRGYVATSPSGTSDARHGPFAYRFQEGDVLYYRMDGYASGMGFSEGDSSDIGLNLGFDLSLSTDKVKSDGTAELTMAFESVEMNGGFMGNPVNLFQTKNQAQAQLGDGVSLDEKALAANPQLSFFREPIRMTAGPDGEVVKIDEASSMKNILSPADVFAPAVFPSSQLEVGDTWESKFKLPVPGLGAPAGADAVNTVVGYEYVGNRYCAVIDQVLSAEESDGTISSSDPITGDSFGLTMPHFLVRGANRIWFDTNDGKMVQTTMDLQFELILGQEFEPLRNLMNAYSSLLNEVEGGAPADPEQTDLLDMAVGVEAQLYLVE